MQDSLRHAAIRGAVLPLLPMIARTLAKRPLAAASASTAPAAAAARASRGDGPARARRRGATVEVLPDTQAPDERWVAHEELGYKNRNLYGARLLSPADDHSDGAVALAYARAEERRFAHAVGARVGLGRGVPTYLNADVFSVLTSFVDSARMFPYGREGT